jgi:hypothetical protein
LDELYAATACIIQCIADLSHLSATWYLIR